MPYDPDTHTITGAVGLHDIQRAIGAAKGEELRDHPNINKWAKFRAVRFGQPSGGGSNGTLTDSERMAACYGWNPWSTTSILQIIDIYNNDDELNGWVNATPRGVSYSEWFRVTDFVGYYHDATPPFVKWTPTTQQTIANNAQINLSLIPTLPNLLKSSVTIVDLAEASRQTGDALVAFLGILLVRGTGHTTQSASGLERAIGRSTVGMAFTNDGYTGMNAQIKISVPGWGDSLAGDWTAYPFFTLKQFTPTTWTSWGVESLTNAGRFYTIPRLSPWTVSLRKSSGGGGIVYKSFSAVRNESANSISYEFTITNGDTQSKTIEYALFIFWPSSASPLTHTAVSPEMRLMNGSVTLAAGASQSFSGVYGPPPTTTGYSSELYNSCAMWLVIGNEATKYFIPKIQPED